jgi:hypothetical protein
MSRTYLGWKRRPLAVEVLEDRLAPAVLLNPTTVSYQDVDGDNVTVHVSKGTLTPASLTFDSAFGNSGPQQLRKVNLAVASFQGASLSVTATPSVAHGGDGFANVGQIYALGIDLGTVVVDGDLGEVTLGNPAKAANGMASLTVQSLGRFGMVTGATSAESDIQGGLGALQVHSDLVGVQLTCVGAAGQIGQVSIGGSLLRGTGGFEGGIHADGTIGAVTIRGDLDGGFLYAKGNMGLVTLGGSLVGGAADESGTINTGGNLAGIHVGGSVLGGAGSFSGYIHSEGNLGSVKIGGSLHGGDGSESGEVIAGGSLAGFACGGSLEGGNGDLSGLVVAKGNMGPVKIGGDLRAAAGNQSAEIRTHSSLASITVGGSVVGGSRSHSGAILVDGSLGPVNISGDLVGGSASGTGDLIGTGSISADRIARVLIGGSVIAGTDATSGTFSRNAAIQAKDTIGAITIKGSLLGNSTSPVVISARGQAVEPAGATRDVAIASLSISVRVKYTNILAGYDVNLNPVNADAQIGAVKVGTDWVASNLVAGVAAGSDGLFGTADDVLIPEAKSDPKILASIASVTIHGLALGTTGGGDRFGIVAQKIGAMSVNQVPLPLTTAVVVLSPETGGDFTVRETV